MRFLLLIILALLPSFADAQGLFSRKKPIPAPSPRFAVNAANANASTALQNGDVIQMRLSGPPEEYTREFSMELAVDDGTVTIPMIGRIRAAGLTPAQLSNAIEKQLIDHKIFTVANININIMVGQQRFVIVGGAVRAPGRQMWTSNLTLTAAIIAAGGPAEFIEDGVRLTRNGQVERYSRKAIKANPGTDPKLQPNDVVEAEGEF